MRHAVHIMLLFSVVAARAEPLNGRVVGVSDGDTITVLVAQQQVEIRLADIDAPESKQAFGSQH